MESSDFLGEIGNPNLTGDRPPPPPGSEEFRATKKVRHREEESPTPLGYRERLLARTDHSTMMENLGNNIDYRGSMLAGLERLATLEELGQGYGIKVAPGDVSVDKSMSIPSVTLSPKLKERLAQKIEVLNCRQLTGEVDWVYTTLRKAASVVGYVWGKGSRHGRRLFLGPVCNRRGISRGCAGGSMDVAGELSASANMDDGFPSSSLVTFDHDNVISAIGEAVWKVFRIDYNTSGMQRGKFARLAVNVDLTKPLVSKFTIDGEEFKVEYENLQELCFHCGMYGHIREGCIHRPKVGAREELGEEGIQALEKTNAPEVYGPWMIVEKRRKPQGRRRSDLEGQKDETPRGSRFDVLGTVDESTRDNEVHIPWEMPSLAGTRPDKIEDVRGGRKKGKHVLHGKKNLDTHKRGENSRNSIPAKATFGEFFEFTSKARMEEMAIPQGTTLDSRTHTVVRMERASPSSGEQVGTHQLSREEMGNGEQENEGIKIYDTLMVEPEVDLQDTRVMGRPPDEGREVAMAIELDGDGGGNDLEVMSDHLLLEGALKTLIRIHNLHVIALFEPRISGDQADRTIRNIGLPNSYRVEATGFSGGIWLLWDDHWQVEILKSTSQYIHCKIWDDMDVKFVFSAVYGHPAPALRNLLWQQLSEVQEGSTLPWVLMGDFNAIAQSSERVGGSTRRTGVSKEFVHWLHSSRLIDLGFLAQEAVHSMRHKSGKEGLIALKVDLEKAYDRLNANFMEWELDYIF
ncbi:hypothetical protein AAHA92_14630 [Salvia divinorum]|uniref:CCHC-type domain-containing protein n=1 Tax=Salvia divinorum TaxID=28513 RepID=A0ABD1HC70_SALDI